MTPNLHQKYTVPEAIAAFGNDTRPEFYCDNEFVVLSNVVLCFVAVGDAHSESHVPSPSRIVWRPSRLDYAPSDEYPWLPDMVREVCDRSQKQIRRIRDHHVFLCLPGDERLLYAGRAHLGSYGGPISGGTTAERSANFYLDEKLPKDVWLRLGGYPGWLIEVNHQAHRVESGDVTAFRHLAEELLRQEFSHLHLTRYEEDSLTLHTNNRRGWLMYLQTPDDGGLYTHYSEYSGDPDVEEVFHCVCGISLEFPARQTLPRGAAILVAEDYFRTGVLPNSTPWFAE